MSESEDDLTPDSGPDVEFASIAKVQTKERTPTRRAATKPIRYNDDSDDDHSSGEVLYDNNLVKEDKKVAGVISDSSDSDESPPNKPQDTSENMFDSLIGKLI